MCMAIRDLVTTKEILITPLLKILYGLSTVFLEHQSSSSLRAFPFAIPSAWRALPHISQGWLSFILLLLSYMIPSYRSLVMTPSSSTPGTLHILLLCFYCVHRKLAFETKSHVYIYGFWSVLPLIRISIS